MPTQEPIQDAVTTKGELIQVMDARASFYRLMSGVLLHEFTSEQIERLSSIELPQSDSELVAQGLADIRRYLRRAGADPRTDLAVDYARIFLSAGVYDGLTAEPYESAFTSKDHLMYQEARDDAMLIYRAYGYEVDPALHMPEDHLGVELEFVSVLADRTARAIGDDASDQEVASLLQAQRGFIAGHVLNWIDALTAKVDEFARLPLYPAFMRIAKGYAADDLALLDELIEALA